MEIMGVKIFLGKDGKMTSEHKLVRIFLEAFKMQLAIIESILSDDLIVKDKYFSDMCSNLNLCFEYVSEKIFFIGFIPKVGLHYPYIFIMQHISILF